MTFEQMFMRAQNEINRIKKEMGNDDIHLQNTLSKRDESDYDEIHHNQLNQCLIQQQQQEFRDFIENAIRIHNMNEF